MTISTSVPAQFTSGDTVAWKISLSDYPASAGWVLHYVLLNALQKITIDAASSGDDHLVTIPSATSSAYSSGEYRWQAYVTKAAERFTVATGSLTVLQGFADLSAGFDTRSHVKKTLEAIESWLENKNPAVAEYEIAGRRMRYIGIGDLLNLRDRYKQELARENIANGIGLGGRGKLQVRF